jgi:hypothetical protein
MGALARAFGGLVSAVVPLACGGGSEPGAPTPAPADTVKIVRLCGHVVESLDAASLDGLEAGVGGVYLEGDCNAACGSGVWASCRPFDEAGVPLIDCQDDCTGVGRRPEGLAAAPATAKRGDSLGVYLAEMARLEAASVDAFRRLRLELAAHAAPRRLVRGAARAGRDEVRHARMTAALARRHGVVPAPSRVARRSIRDLESIARENAVEGCVHEGFGALVATFQARTAGDPVIRAVMGRIAPDETRHGELAFAIDAWMRGRLDRGARRHVDDARRTALESLTAGGRERPTELREALGLPSRAQRRALAEGMRRLTA